MAVARRQAVQLPVVLVATVLVIGVPLGVVWMLSVTEAVDSLVVLGLVAVVLAFATTRIGETIARRFGRQLAELMIWGWLRGLFYERRLERAWERVHNEQRTPAREMAERFRELSDALEASDTYTSGHSRRVARHCERIARRLGLDEAQISHLRVAAAIHDVGKVNVPAEILRKPARLTEAEFEMIKLHTVDGARMVAQLEDAKLTRAVRSHHERIDGSGYPDGLVAAEIPVEARIIAVADTFDAITSSRPYRPARPRRAALAILEAEAGSKLDPEAVRALRSTSLASWSVLTSLPERAVSAMGGALNTMSASTAAGIVAVVAVIGIGVSNPSSVASVVRATPIPGVVDAIVPGGGDDDQQSEPPSGDPRSVQPSGSTASPASAPKPRATPAGADSGGPGAGPTPSLTGTEADPSQPAPPNPGPAPNPPQPGPAPPKPPPPGPPPRQPELLDPVTDLLPTQLGNVIKGLTDPLLPPR